MATARSLPRFHDRIDIANLRASPFCLGLVRDPRVIPAAFDAGINFFFVSSDLHWPLYQATRDGLAMLLARGGGVRHSLVVVVATYMVHREMMLTPLYELVHAIAGLDRVDIVLAGGCYANDFEPRVGALRGWTRSGCPPLAGAAVGATLHDRTALLRGDGDEGCDVTYVRYNPAHSGGRVDLYPHLRRRVGKAVLSFKSTAGFQELIGATPPEYWRPRITDAYRYALSQPAHDGVLLSLGNERELHELSAALAEGPLSEEEQSHLELLAGAGQQRFAS
jgi:hypothetical protein